MTDEMKTCTRCGEVKALKAFGKDARKQDGRRSDCKGCRNTAIRESRAEKGYAPRTIAIETLREQVARGYRDCVTCEEAKPLGDFPKSPKHPGGAFPQCKECACLRSKAWRREE